MSNISLNIITRLTWHGAPSARDRHVLDDFFSPGRIPHTNLTNADDQILLLFKIKRGLAN
jgi:hypothetical protein